EKKDVAQFHVGRITLLRACEKAAKSDEERLAYQRQVVDSLAAAFQTGFFAKGLELLEVMTKGDGKIASYAAFRRVSADFAARNDEPGANLMANKKKWMGALKESLSAHPAAEEAPEALIQLASASEFNAEEEDARKYYEQLVRDFAASDAGKKAA